MARRLAADEERPAHVHREHGVEVLDGGVRERRVLGVEEARAGHHDVRRGPERLLGAVEERAHGVRVRHVAADGHGAVAAGGELRDELVGPRGVGRVVDHDARAERGELGGHLAADPAGAAGDERDAAGERERRRVPSACECHGYLVAGLA